MILPQTSIFFARNISHRFPSFLIAFAQIFPLLLPEFPITFARISGKSNGKFGQNQWENLGKSNEKTRESGGIYFLFRAKIIAFARISHCFFPNFPLLLPEFPMAFARISHGFCPNFPLLFPEFFVFKKWGWGGGGTVLPCPPPPRLLRL